MIDRRTFALGAGTTLTSVLMGGGNRLHAQAALGAPLRVAAVKFGAVNWLLDTIRAEGLATAAGLDLVAVELANNQAGPIALLSGNADIIVNDWPWALRQRGLGEPVKFAPYSSTLGAVMVPAASPIQSLRDLAGKRIGVAGSGIDKSWLLLQAYARRKLSFDIASKATIQFGAAPLLSEQVRSGSLDAVLNYWTQNVRLSTLGLRPVITMAQVLSELEIAPIPAFVGFIWKEKTEAEKGPQIAAFLQAASAANERLATSDAAWTRLDPLLKASSPAEASALRAAYTSGIATAWTPADTQAASKLMQILIEAGDTELIGSATKFDPKLFHVSHV